MGYTPNKVRAKVAELRPELAQLAIDLQETSPGYFCTAVTENLPLYLDGAFASMVLQAVAGPDSLRISWNWRHPDGGYNGKDLCYVTVNWDDDPGRTLVNDLLNYREAVLDPDPDLAALLGRAADFITRRLSC
jgi:hypothetical protein